MTFWLYHATVHVRLALVVELIARSSLLTTPRRLYKHVLHLEPACIVKTRTIDSRHLGRAFVTCTCLLLSRLISWF